MDSEVRVCRAGVFASSACALCDSLLCVALGVRMLPSVTLPFGPSAKGGRPPAVADLEPLVNRYLHPLHHSTVIFLVNLSNALSCFL